MFEFIDKELGGSVDRMKARILSISKDRRYSAEYLADFTAKQYTDLKAIVRASRAQASAKADKMRQEAKDHYLLESIDSFDMKETALFRDFAAASATDALIELAKDPGALNAENVLILGGELRRRNENVMADVLATSRPPSAEPWKESSTWKAADLLLADFESCDAAEHYALQLGTASGPFVMTSEGPRPMNDLLL